MPPASPAARHALAADLDRLTETLASAFRDDPLLCWMFEDPQTRPEHRRAWMRFALEMGMTRGHVYSAAQQRAAAIWSPPDVTLFDELWAPRMLETTREGLGEKAGEKLAALTQAMTSHPIEEPHFYLFVLGTHAESQGSGYGAEVLAPVLRICDAQGLAAHLESSNARNLPFYRRHGFEVVAEVPMPNGPVVRPMRRPPPGPGRRPLGGRDSDSRA